jgi:hypothetical protein
MRHILKLHPQSQSDVVTSIEVKATRHGSHQLHLHYFVTANMTALRFPPLIKAKRGEKLWEHSCFEAFLCAAQNDSYCELNFAPSREWAAYGFDRHREGMHDLSDISIRYFVNISGEAGYEMQVSLDLSSLSDRYAGSAWHLGIAAVMEEMNGNKSYWALAHPPGAPDFHNRDCFELKLPPQE